MARLNGFSASELLNKLNQGIGVILSGDSRIYLKALTLILKMKCAILEC